MKKSLIFLLMLVSGVAHYGLLHAVDEEIDIIDSDVDEENDESEIENKLEELRKLIGDDKRVKRFFNKLEKREGDENLVVPCLLAGFQKGIGIKRLELFEKYLSLRGDSDLLVYYIAEKGNENQLREYFEQGGILKFFEKVYDQYSIDLTHRMLEAYVNKAKESNPLEAKEFIKHFVKKFEEPDEETDEEPEAGAE